MKRAEAPPAGWYPDPTGRAGLRWWDGLDWTDHRRAPLPAARQEFTSHADRDSAAEAADTPTGRGAPPAGWSPSRSTTGSDETAELMAEARKAARAEVDRAVQDLSNRARDARRQFEPLVSQYGDRVLRGLKVAGIVLVALAVLWMVLQTVGQTSLLNWIGDRIDAVTEGHVGQRVGLPTWRGSNP